MGLQRPIIERYVIVARNHLSVERRDGDVSQARTWLPCNVGIRVGILKQDACTYEKEPVMRVIILAAALLIIAVVIFSALSRSAKDEKTISPSPAFSAPGQKPVGNSAIGHGGPPPAEGSNSSGRGTGNEGAQLPPPGVYP